MTGIIIVGKLLRDQAALSESFTGSLNALCLSLSFCKMDTKTSLKASRLIQVSERFEICAWIKIIKCGAATDEGYMLYRFRNKLYAQFWRIMFSGVTTHQLSDW